MARAGKPSSERFMRIMCNVINYELLRSGFNADFDAPVQKGEVKMLLDRLGEWYETNMKPEWVAKGMAEGIIKGRAEGRAERDAEFLGLLRNTLCDALNMKYGADARTWQKKINAIADIALLMDLQFQATLMPDAKDFDAYLQNLPPRSESS